MWACTEGGTRKGQSQGRVCIEGRGSHTIPIIRKKINASVKELAKKAEVKKMSWFALKAILNELYILGKKKKKAFEMRSYSSWCTHDANFSRP